MRRHNISAPITDAVLNYINQNFITLFNEYVQAGDNARDARNKAEQAVADSLLAKETAEVTREEMLDIIREQTQNGDLAPEIAQARQGHETIGENFNSVKSQLAQIAVNAIDFPSVQLAIDYVESNGGGKVLVSHSHSIDAPVHVKRRVTLDFNQSGQFLYQKNTGHVIVVHRDSFVHNPRIIIPHEYNDSVILVDSEFMYWNKLANVTNVNVAKLEFNPNTANCTTVEFKGKPHEVNNRTVSGFSYVKFDGLFTDGLNNVLKMSTEGNGWITACKLLNFNANNFVHLIHTEKIDEESLGIDTNIFDGWEVQTQDMTREIFKDYDSTNVYTNFKLWDMHTNPQSSLGTITGSFISQVFSNRHEPAYITSTLYGSRGYKYLGRFNNLTSSSSFAVFTIKGRNLDIDSEISISARSGQPQVTRKHYGRTIMLKDRLSFHLVHLPDGQVDLYVKPSSEYDVSLYLKDYLLFTANSEGSLWEQTLNEGVEIENDENIYFSVKPVSKIETTTPQSVEPATPTVVNVNRRLIDNRFSYNTSEPGKIYCVQTGIYQVIAKVQYNSPISGDGRILFRVNGVIIGGGNSENTVALVPDIANVLNASTVLELNEGDYVEVLARHTSTNSLNVRGELTLFKISD